MVDKKKVLELSFRKYIEKPLNGWFVLGACELFLTPGENLIYEMAGAHRLCYFKFIQDFSLNNSLERITASDTSLNDFLESMLFFLSHPKDSSPVIFC
jgi:hypothetical protein